MKKAKGTHGTGAGSVFWKKHLKAYHKSYTNQLLKRLAKLAGVKLAPTSLKKILKASKKVKKGVK